jgi:flagellar protein FlaG
MEIRQIPNVQPYQSGGTQGEAAGDKDQELQVVKRNIVQEDISREKPIAEKDLNDMIESANQFFKLTKTHLNFQFHNETNKYFVKIVNTDTNETLKEIPSKEFLDMVARLQKFAGIIIDEKI